LFLSFLFSLFAFYEVALVGCFVYLKLATWISSEVLNVDWGFMFDRGAKRMWQSVFDLVTKNFISRFNFDL